MAQTLNHLFSINIMKMENLLEQAERAYRIAGRKLDHLNERLLTVGNENRISLELEIETITHQFEKLRLLYLGKKMEQAGRELYKAAKNIQNTPGELEIIISSLQEIPKHKNLQEVLDLVHIKNQLSDKYLDEALDKINDTYRLLFNIEEEEDDDDDDPDQFPDPKTNPPSGEKKLIDIILKK